MKFASQAIKNLRQSLQLSWREHDELEEEYEELEEEYEDLEERYNDLHDEAEKLDDEAMKKQDMIDVLAETGAIAWLLEMVLAGMFGS